eukprot:CAMPEP_0169203318 /NCGR_PEP_ID=MMETSP1016-20121227/11402_1 /TAXON_ID=342587 /ORGANISM="Karlodinium micrum, Strain CCMP2283" /LENGTH=54 /DNA_ID=CAMNT_0009280353 /DNA_START=63 /DNA_END=224 /DNA_ORIENTATION=-
MSTQLMSATISPGPTIAPLRTEVQSEFAIDALLWRATIATCTRTCVVNVVGVAN